MRRCGRGTVTAMQAESDWVNDTAPIHWIPLELAILEGRVEIISHSSDLPLLSSPSYRSPRSLNREVASNSWEYVDGNSPFNLNWRYLLIGFPCWNCRHITWPEILQYSRDSARNIQPSLLPLGRRSFLRGVLHRWIGVYGMTFNLYQSP